jgi:C1A family cysteine protease
MSKPVKIAALLAIVGLISTLFGVQEKTQTMNFEEFKSVHGLKFTSKFEEAYRERIFNENIAKISAHNSRNDQSYEMGVNQFTAMTQEEFVNTFLGTVVPKTNVIVDETDNAVGDVDWTTKNILTPVKNQGSCGSCWAFSATGAIEAAYGLKGTHVSLSEQQLVDCSASYGNQACNGGLMDNAFKYVKAQGLTTDSDYKYTAVKGTCKVNTGPHKITGYTDTPGCTAVANAIASRPLSVAVDATNWSPYRSGVFSNCGTSLNHGVLLVGIDAAAWKIKNSWGTSWGESGFIRLARGNTCGVCNVVSYPSV